jgi:hypothetical protein
MLKKFAIALGWVAATFLGSLCIVILLILLTGFVVGMQSGLGIDPTMTRKITFWLARYIYLAPMTVAVITLLFCAKGKLPWTGLGKCSKADKQESE